VNRFLVKILIGGQHQVQVISRAVPSGYALASAKSPWWTVAAVTLKSVIRGNSLNRRVSASSEKEEQAHLQFSETRGIGDGALLAGAGAAGRIAER